jgi:hypothetical protein
VGSNPTSGIQEIEMDGRLYIIDGGEVFFGTVEQFQDCFFSNANHELIVEWAEEIGATIKWVDPIVEPDLSL